MIYRVPKLIINRAGVSIQLWHYWRSTLEWRRWTGWPVFVLTMWWRWPPSPRRYR